MVGGPKSAGSLRAVPTALDSFPLFKPCSLVPDTNNFGLKSKNR